MGALDTMKSLIPGYHVGRHRDVSRANLSDYWSWVKQSMQFGGHTYSIGQGGISTSYGKLTAEPIANSFEGYAAGLLMNDGPISSVEAFRLRVFAQAPPLFQTRQDNGRPGDLFDDEGLDILRKPWPGGTFSDLMKRALIHGDLGGNAYIVEIDGELVLLRPDWVEIVLAPRVFMGQTIGYKQVGIAYYEGGVNTANPAIFVVGEYVHFVPGLPDPLASYRGMSWLTPVIREAQSDRAATDHGVKFFENAATPNLAVSLPKEVTPAQFAAFVDKMDASHTGVENAYKTLYTGGGADVTVIGTNMQQMNLTGIQGKLETRIANAGGVPPVLLSFSEGMQGSSLNAGNYTPAKRNFVDTTGRDLWANWYGSLEVLVPPPGDRDRLTYDPRDIPFLHEDQTDVAQIKQIEAATMNTLVTAGWEKASIISAVVAGDWTLLKDTGLVSVQLLPPGTTGEPTSGPSGDKPTPPGGEAGRSQADDDEDPDSIVLDAQEQALFDALAILDADNEAGRARWDPSVHPRGPDGKFINVGDLLADAIRQHRAGNTDVNPFDSFSRERLRRVAVRRGLAPPRGASRADLEASLRNSIAQPPGRPVPTLHHQPVPPAPGAYQPTLGELAARHGAIDAVYVGASPKAKLDAFDKLSKNNFDNMDHVDRNMILGSLESIRTTSIGGRTISDAEFHLDRLDPGWRSKVAAANPSIWPPVPTAAPAAPVGVQGLQARHFRQNAAMTVFRDPTSTPANKLIAADKISKADYDAMPGTDRGLIFVDLSNIKNSALGPTTIAEADRLLTKFGPPATPTGPNLRNRKGRHTNALAAMNDPLATDDVRVVAYNRLSKADFDTLPSLDRSRITSDLNHIAKYGSPAPAAQAKTALNKFTPPGTPAGTIPTQSIHVPAAATPGQTRFPGDGVKGMFEVLPAAKRGQSGDGWTRNPDGSSGPWGKYGAAGILLRHTDDKGVDRFLMVQRGPGISDPGKWQFPGGAIDQHETMAQGAAREVVEELGFKEADMLDATVHGFHEVKLDSGWKYTSFAATVSKPHKADLSGHHARMETSDAKWMTVAEIDALDSNGDLLKPLEKGKLHDNVRSLFPPSTPGTKNTPPKLAHKQSRAVNLIPDKASEDKLRQTVAQTRKTFRGKTADERLAAIGAMQGHDETPTVVSKADFDKLLKTGDYIEAWRGVQGSWRGGSKSAAEINEEFRSGPAYYGTGIFGNGYYLSTRKSVAEQYSDGTKNSVVRVLIPKSAKFEEFNDVNKRAMATSSSTSSHFSGGRQGDLGGATLRNPGRYAAASGLDGIEITTYSSINYSRATHIAQPGKPSYAWQNRSVLIVQEAEK